MIRKAMLAAVLGMFGTAALAAPKTKAQVLKSGEYTATAKALVCTGCAPQIEQTIKGFPGVESAAVNPDGGSVRFNVKKGATVKLDDLQAALKAGSDKMGMGADYTLRDVKRAPAAKKGKSN